MAAAMSSISLAVSVPAAAAASLASSRSSLAGVTVSGSNAAVWKVRKPFLVSCSSEQREQDEVAVSRRSAVALLAGLGTLGVLRPTPALAAYGETANIFGPTKKDTGFTTYSGEGFSVSLPAKWNPSKEVEFPGQVLRYEDNFDQVSNLSVSILPSDKKSIKDYGSPEAFLKSVSYLLGKQSYKGQTQSEGGFDANSVATASVFKADEIQVNGKPYYSLAVLTRTGDGTEGGRHQYIVGTVTDGKLYLLKAQAGDKRWFKGTSKFVEGAASSFTVA